MVAFGLVWFGLGWVDLVWFWVAVGEDGKTKKRVFFLGSMVHRGVMMMSYVEDTLARLMRDNTGTTAQSGTGIQYSLLQTAFLGHVGSASVPSCLAMGSTVLLSSAPVSVPGVLGACPTPSSRHAARWPVLREHSTARGAWSRTALLEGHLRSGRAAKAWSCAARHIGSDPTRRANIGGQPRFDRWRGVLGRRCSAIGNSWSGTESCTAATAKVATMPTS